MNKTEQELDTELEQMSDEVPPMPADFHERWMNAVRNEQSLRDGPAKADNTERKTSLKTISMIRWTRVLSAAAVFIFLIGGTVLYRNSKKSLNTALNREEAAPVAAESQISEVPAAGGVLPAAKSAVTEKEPSAEEETAENNAMAAVTEGFAENADFAAGSAPLLSAANRTDTALKASQESAATEEAEMVYEAAEAETEAEAYEEAADFMAMEAPAEVPAATVLPTPASTVLSTPEVTAEPAEHTKEPKDGFFQNAEAFLTDMGDFLLAALPYLIVLAVPAVIALVIHRKKRKTAG